MKNFNKYSLILVLIGLGLFYFLGPKDNAFSDNSTTSSNSSNTAPSDVMKNLHGQVNTAHKKIFGDKFEKNLKKGRSLIGDYKEDQAWRSANVSYQRGTNYPESLNGNKEKELRSWALNFQPDSLDDENMTSWGKPVKPSRENCGSAIKNIIPQYYKKLHYSLDYTLENKDAILNNAKQRYYVVETRGKRIITNEGYNYCLKKYNRALSLYNRDVRRREAWNVIRYDLSLTVKEKRKFVDHLGDNIHAFHTWEKMNKNKPLKDIMTEVYKSVPMKQKQKTDFDRYLEVKAQSKKELHRLSYNLANSRRDASTSSG